MLVVGKENLMMVPESSTTFQLKISLHEPVSSLARDVVCHD